MWYASGMTEERPRNRRPLQFRLRTLLLSVLVLSLPLSCLAVLSERARKQREAVEAIEQLGGWTDDWVSPVELLLGRDGAPVCQASLRGTGANDTALRHVCNLYALEDLDLSGTEVTDDGIACLASMWRLRSVGLEDTQVTPEGFKRLQQALPRCKIE